MPAGCVIGKLSLHLLDKLIIYPCVCIVFFTAPNDKVCIYHFFKVFYMLVAKVIRSVTGIMHKNYLFYLWKKIMFCHSKGYLFVGNKILLWISCLCPAWSYSAKINDWYWPSALGSLILDTVSLMSSWKTCFWIHADKFSSDLSFAAHTSKTA